MILQNNNYKQIPGQTHLLFISYLFMGNARCFNKLESFTTTAFTEWITVMCYYYSTLGKHSPDSVPPQFVANVDLGSPR